ncbi:MAG: hypothetical protein A2057_00740 [Ignavibacteria bacterium GWA2_35_9]|nr:MAG: hypothetical protein A2057_00740 [Ignavibacteria bacterium GWA2_35_9]OGU45260.1 MAG: hypothetical protein A2000_03650 [Ignavibacteria bacterium GWB2_36_8]OGU53265.1 MAG: hypothetical protein A2080_01955 [Ignavibacteria bacterium GWC2_36_12]
MSTAILVDGGFFINRYRKVFRNGNYHNPKTIIENLYRMIMRHLDNDYLYRILYYDCNPILKKAHNPISNKAIDFSKTKQATFRVELLNELKKRRKVAIRLGDLKESGAWLIKPEQTKMLLNKTLKIEELKEYHVFYELRQKGVDIKIGLDIASMAYKKSVNRIILISGDGDFVPAAKLARREGIDFILDPMWNAINPSLHEHIDGLKSTCENPKVQYEKYPYLINNP